MSEVREVIAHFALAAFHVPGFRIDNYTSTRTRRIRSARLPYDFQDGLAAGREITAQHERARREQSKPGYVWP